MRINNNKERIFGETMEEVVCFCLKCNAELGVFKNSFDGIGNTYFSPREPLTGVVYGFQATGHIYQAASGSEVENSVLRDLACSFCNTVVGLRCDGAPEESRLRAVVSVKERFALTFQTPKNLPTAEIASSGQLSQTLTTSSLNGIRISEGNILPPPTPSPNHDVIQQDLDNFKTWAKNSIAVQRADINRIGGIVDRIEKGMKAFRDFMSEVRTDIAIIRHEGQTEDDIMSFRSDLNGFRDELATYRQKQDQMNSKMSPPDVSKHELQTLSRDVQNVRQRHTEIDALKTELNYLKTQLESRDSIIHKPYSIGHDGHLLGLNGAFEGLDEKAFNSLLQASTHVQQREVESHKTGGQVYAYGNLNQSNLATMSNASPQYSSVLPYTINGSDTESYSNTLNLQQGAVADSQDSSFRSMEQLLAPSLLGQNEKTKAPQHSSTNIATEADPATDRSIPNIWTYTSSSHYLALTKVCRLLGLTYPKIGGILGAKRLIEAHINDNKLSESPVATQYGTVEPQIISEQLNEATLETLPIKRRQRSINKPFNEKREMPTEGKRKRKYAEESTQKKRKRQEEERFENNSAKPIEGPSARITIYDSFASQDDPPGSEPPSAHQNSDMSLVAAITKNSQPPGSIPSTTSSKKPRDLNGGLSSLRGRPKRESTRHKQSLELLMSPKPSNSKNKSPTICRNSTSSAAFPARPATAEKSSHISIIIPKIRAPDPSTLSLPVERAHIPFHCGVCKKSFMSIINFRRHKKSPSCNDTEYDEERSNEELEVRKRKLAEREKMVVQELGVD